MGPRGVIAMPGFVYAIATMDTKGIELAFVASILRAAGVPVITVDVGTLTTPSIAADISRTEVQAAASIRDPNDASNDRGLAIGAMAKSLTAFLQQEQQSGKVLGVLGIGGSGGTSLITTAMRALPIGLPKLMVSTVASGNTSPYVDCSDIMMMYSVVDIAGLNVVSEIVLANAAYAMAGMATSVLPERQSLPALGMTMFGVTTPCVTRVRERFELDGYDCLVFHATGAGGRAMEHLVESGLITGVLDITTTEVADEIVGGVFPAGPHRFDKVLKSRVPVVMSLGALDMVNFGPMESVPEKFRSRRLYIHNQQVTLMRTNQEESREIAKWIASKLNRSIAPVTLLIPEAGLSLLDVPGQPFYDPETNKALFDELTQSIDITHDRKIRSLPFAINDPEFADAIGDEFRLLTQQLR